MLSVTPVTTTATIAPSEPVLDRHKNSPGTNSPAEPSAEAKSTTSSPNAIDPVHQSSGSQSIRDGERQETRPDRDLPAGPPPAFIETILQRQKREAFNPQEVSKTYEAARIPEAVEPQLDVKN